MKNLNKAFTLVELSVVILVIGILITGITTGINLYDDFKLTVARQLTNNSIVNRIDGLTLWLETASTKSFTSELPKDNEIIQQLNDINPQRTLKINLYQNNSGSSPKYSRKGVNGLPALLFANSTSLNSKLINYIDIGSYQEATMFSVSHILKTSGTNFTLGYVNEYRFTFSASDTINYSPANQVWFGICCPTSNRLTLGNNALVVNKLRIDSVVINGSYMSRRFNYNQASSSSNIKTGFIPYNAPSSTFYISSSGLVYVAEVIIFNRALKEKERYEVEKYLSKKWSINIGQQN